jgi:hypothetical protein
MDRIENKEVSDQTTDKRPLFEGKCLSTVFFTQFNKIIEVGSKGKFTEKDLFKIDSTLVPSDYPTFKAYLENNRTAHPNRSFFFILMGSIKKYIYIGGAIFLFIDSFQCFIPIFLRLFLNWIEDPEAASWKGYVYAAVLTSVTLSRTFWAQYGAQLLNIGSISLNNYIGMFIFETVTNSKKVDVGIITKYLTSDMRMVKNCATTMDQIFTIPVLIIIYTSMIVYITGWIGFSDSCDHNCQYSSSVLHQQGVYQHLRKEFRCW